MPRTPTNPISLHDLPDADLRPVLAAVLALLHVRVIKSDAGYEARRVRASRYIMRQHRKKPLDAVRETEIG